VGDDEIADLQLREHESNQREVAWHLKRVRPSYAQALASVWLANGAASLAVLSFIGASLKDPSFSRLFLIPLWCFALGLISMAVGTAFYLIAERNRVRTLEEHPRLLDRPLGSTRRLSESAGLTFDDWRTRSAILAAILFVIGCVLGLIVLTFYR
jgi:hypothetical protein